jgi:lipopolysaccharide export system protein LptA
MSRNHTDNRSVARVLAAFSAASLLVLASAAGARSSDRNKPMDIYAGHQSGTFSGDSVNPLSGGVHITQGTLDITSDTAKITLSDGEPVRAVFTGSVVLKQQMDDGTPMTSKAASVDYNLDTEVVVFTGDVSIVQPRGSMSGDRVVYNLKTGGVESGGQGSGRVHMRILPKSARGGGDAGGAPGDGN